MSDEKKLEDEQLSMVNGGTAIYDEIVYSTSNYNKDSEDKGQLGGEYHIKFN